MVKKRNFGSIAAKRGETMIGWESKCYLGRDMK
jgi:hypothetical protein